jgi:hypothetical protein
MQICKTHGLPGVIQTEQGKSEGCVDAAASVKMTVPHLRATNPAVPRLIINSSYVAECEASVITPHSGRPSNTALSQCVLTVFFVDKHNWHCNPDIWT